MGRIDGSTLNFLIKSGQKKPNQLVKEAARMEIPTAILTATSATPLKTPR